jgi:multiple sugar transport system substrate-binding protein
MILSALVNHAEGFRNGGQHLQGVAMKRTPPIEDLQFSRRAALRGLATAAGLVTIPGALAACSSGTSSAGSGGASASGGTSSGTISFGSNYSDPAPKQAFAALVSNAKKATGVGITVNTVDHNTFQDDITSYLQGTPNDLATWFAGYRMQYFAAQGLLEPIDDVWDKIGANFSDAVKSLCKGADGKYYFVPIYNYPWVVFYNKSTFTQKGYTVPATWDDLITLAKKMKSDGLVPFAFADKDQWPALGMFDILNLRVNGFDYHIKLMHNQASTRTRRSRTCSPSGVSSCPTCRAARQAASGRTGPRPWKPSRRA